MSSTQEGSSLAGCIRRKEARNRHCWSTAEEVALLSALKDLIAQGWKLDNGFRAGYLNRVEMALKRDIPNCELKAMPHVNSKIASWKNFYNSLSQILSRSGVGFNTRGNYMIECEDDQWDQIIKADPAAKGMRYKNLPYYEDWCEIFSKDRANGENAEDIYEAFAALQTPEDLGGDAGEGSFHHEVHEQDEEQVSQNSRDGTHISNRSAAKRRKKGKDLYDVCELLAEMNHATNKRLEHIAKRIGYEFDMGKARQDVLNQLGEIPGLSIENKFTICELVSFKLERLDIWCGMQLEARKQYVDHLLKFTHV